ncbi:MAG: hypothetical protein EXR07_14410 [Acetobacteraceae bacterium]|nr:hypothetical protein [Acetobacteraceae bacterium]
MQVRQPHAAFGGGVGAWGIGTTEVMHVFATQTLIVRKPKTLRANFHGKLPRGLYAKDMILALIGKYGIEAGIGHVVQYAGPVIVEHPELVAERIVRRASWAANASWRAPIAASPPRSIQMRRPRWGRKSFGPNSGAWLKARGPPRNSFGVERAAI